MINQIDDPSCMGILNEFKEGNVEMLLVRFIRGLVHQAHQQTGHARPIGETTAIRICHDILGLLYGVGVDVKMLDMAKLTELIELSKFAPKD